MFDLNQFDEKMATISHNAIADLLHAFCEEERATEKGNILIIIRGRDSSVMFYPYGDTQENDYFHQSVRDGDVVAALRKIQEKWHDGREDHKKRRITAMAQTIMRLTFEQGECTDAALRASDFDQIEIDEFGAAAIARAGEIADSGPFEIRIVESANAA